MPLQFYQYLKKFILFLETILSAPINVTHLKSVDKALIEKEMLEIYLESIMLSGAHELFHLKHWSLGH